MRVHISVILCDYIFHYIRAFFPFTCCITSFLFGSSGSLCIRNVEREIQIKATEGSSSWTVDVSVRSILNVCFFQHLIALSISCLSIQLYSISLFLLRLFPSLLSISTSISFSIFLHLFFSFFQSHFLFLSASFSSSHQSVSANRIYNVFIESYDHFTAITYLFIRTKITSHNHRCQLFIFLLWRKFNQFSSFIAGFSSDFAFTSISFSAALSIFERMNRLRSKIVIVIRLHSPVFLSLSLCYCSNSQFYFKCLRL